MATKYKCPAGEFIKDGDEFILPFPSGKFLGISFSTEHMEPEVYFVDDETFAKLVIAKFHVAIEVIKEKLDLYTDEERALDLLDDEVSIVNKDA